MSSALIVVAEGWEAAASAAPDTIVVQDGSRRYKMAYREGETILDTSRRHGIPLPSNCRQGTCGTCLVQLTKGRVTMEFNDVIGPAEAAERYILACQARGDTAEVEIALF